MVTAAASGGQGGGGEVIVRNLTNVTVINITNEVRLRVRFDQVAHCL